MARAFRAPRTEILALINRLVLVSEFALKQAIHLIAGVVQ
jgi:hypothetical protein